MIRGWNKKSMNLNKRFSVAWIWLVAEDAAPLKRIALSVLAISNCSVKDS